MRNVRVSEAALVERYYATMILERRYLLVPHGLIERERMNEEDRRAIAFIAIFNVDAVDFYLHLTLASQIETGGNLRGFFFELVHAPVSVAYIRSDFAYIFV